MTANIAQISNPSILINPSPRLKQYLGKCGEDPIPKSEGADFEPVDTLFAVTENDRDFIGKFKSNSENCDFKCYTMENTKIPDKGKLLSLKDINNLYKSILKENKFILSLAAGFLFGFTGIELITRSLDLGIRFILGIICASTIAVADLYFLAKKLNNDIQLQSNVY
nr:unnamed protein product [Callosobruchus chinensis]